MEQLLLLNPQLKDKKVAVFGTDRTALRLFSVLLQNHVSVDCFVSRQVHPTKLKIMNKPVISVHSLRERSNIVLAIGNPADEEQAAKLEQDGFEVFYDRNLASYDGDCIFI